MAVVASEHLAWIRESLNKWDAITQMNFADSYYPNMLPDKAWARDVKEESPEFERAHAFWREYVPDEERGYLKVAKPIQFDRIIAIDPLGDGYYPVPHVLIEWDPKSGPFAERGTSWLEHARAEFPRSDVRPTKVNRARLFPRPIPRRLFPPPRALDFTVPESELSTGTANSLVTTIEKFRARAAETASMRSRPTAPRDDTNLVEFRRWREEVAAPTLAAVMRILRDSEHDARIQVVSNPGRETVELRVRLNVGGSAANPNYRPEGHVRFAANPYGSIEVDSWPSPNRGSSSARDYGAGPKAPTLADLDKGRVELEVLQMLDRISW